MFLVQKVSPDQGKVFLVEGKVSPDRGKVFLVQGKVSPDQGKVFLVRGKVFPDRGKVFLVEERLYFGLSNLVNGDFISEATVEESYGKKLIALGLAPVSHPWAKK